jgi:hypothetical protein
VASHQGCYFGGVSKAGKVRKPRPGLRAKGVTPKEGGGVSKGTRGAGVPKKSKPVITSILQQSSLIVCIEGRMVLDHVSVPKASGSSSKKVEDEEDEEESPEATPRQKRRRTEKKKGRDREEVEDELRELRRQISKDRVKIRALEAGLEGLEMRYEEVKGELEE